VLDLQWPSSPPMYLGKCCTDIQSERCPPVRSTIYLPLRVDRAMKCMLVCWHWHATWLRCAVQPFASALFAVCRAMKGMLALACHLAQICPPAVCQCSVRGAPDGTVSPVRCFLSGRLGGRNVVVLKFGIGGVGGSSVAGTSSLRLCMQLLSSCSALLAVGRVLYRRSVDQPLASPSPSLFVRRANVIG